MVRIQVLTFFVITFIASIKGIGTQPDVKEGLPFTEVETIPLSDGSLGMTMAWGTKILTFKDKDSKGKDIIGHAEVLSISTTLRGDLVDGGIYFTYVMLDKPWKITYDSFICGTKWTKQ